MKLNWIDQLGDWNPQLLREIKGRFKSRNLLLSGLASLCGQFWLFRYCQSQLPNVQNTVIGEYNKYCINDLNQHPCPTDATGNFLINWQLWWLDLFTLLSLIGVFALLIGGTYLLISDLAHEERRDTLNFVRLSPQLPQSILLGKLLGVPILLYVVAGLAVPLHLWSGLAAQIPLNLIVSFYGLLFTACFLFYSAALLLGLVGYWLGGFQAWLSSSTILIFLATATFTPIAHTPTDWLNLFSPSLLLSNLIAATGLDIQSTLLYAGHLQLPYVEDLQWFYLPVGKSAVGVISFAGLNFLLWSYWIWQALQRRFPNPSKTILSKRQSYWLVASFEVMILGFAATTPKFPQSTELSVNFHLLLVFNLLLFLGLVVALTPQRQDLQDWARDRRQPVMSRKQRVVNSSLVQSLIWGEKSPAVVAIALNLAIAATFLLPWVLQLQDIDKLPAFVNLVIGCNLILICAAIAQLLTSVKTQKQVLWVTSTMGAVILLPPVILRLISLNPAQAPSLWLFTPFAWEAIEQVSTTTILLSILGQWSVLTLFTLQVTRQLQRAGESNSKTLFASRPLLKGETRN